MLATTSKIIEAAKESIEKSLKKASKKFEKIILPQIKVSYHFEDRLLERFKSEFNKTKFDNESELEEFVESDLFKKVVASVKFAIKNVNPGEDKGFTSQDSHIRIACVRNGLNEIVLKSCYFDN